MFFAKHTISTSEQKQINRTLYYFTSLTVSIMYAVTIHLDYIKVVDTCGSNVSKITLGNNNKIIDLAWFNKLQTNYEDVTEK